MDEPNTAPAIEDEEQGQSQDEQDLIATAKKRFQQAVDAEAENRRDALDDLHFLTGDQWPQELRQKRERQKRPCLTMNMLNKFVHNVTGDARQNKPSIEVHPVDDEADVLTAQVMEGMIRNIEYVSNASAARDTALDQSVKSGFGNYRVNVRYTDDDTFEQEILIQRIPNQFTVYYDPRANEADLSDARWCFVTEKISRQEFKSRFPGKEPVEFDAAEGDDSQWVFQDDVRIAEYWLKEPVKKTICLYELLDAGGNPTGVTEVLEKKSDTPPVGTRLLKERVVNSHKVVMRMIDSSQVLEETQWAGKYIPIITVMGEETVVDGKRHLASVIRWSKDPQRAFNYAWTSAVEHFGMQPKAPYIGTPAMFDGHSEWDNAHTEVYSKMEFETDPQRPSDRPQRSEPPLISPGAVQLLQLSSQGLKDTSGIYDASLGARSNETSGVAIQARQHEGDIATFLWIDNLTRAITYEGKILVDLIPKIYDTERIIRVRGQDGQTSFQKINTVKRDVGGEVMLGPDGKPLPLNDLTLGKYDVVVSVGPLYRTQREKVSDSMVKMTQAFPAIAPITVPRIAKAQDWEGADDIAREIEEKVNPPQPPAPAPGQAAPPGVPGVPMPPQTTAGPSIMP